MIKTTLQLFAATCGILAFASCTVDVDTPDASATTTTTTTTADPYVRGDRTTTRETTTVNY